MSSLPNMSYIKYLELHLVNQISEFLQKNNSLNEDIKNLYSKILKEIIEIYIFLNETIYLNKLSKLFNIILMRQENILKILLNLIILWPKKKKKEIMKLKL